ncbi:hypothetical protein VQ042_20680 [Aurantimonas sp. A2-1-M11]|uniref:hypothetical protein n=1 Tax=Aurantimonas sp. A2-1-M11 TaxID=3113712 RepID=UPI002F91F3AA
MAAYDAYSHHDDASDTALCDVAARAIAAETEVLEAVVAANRRGDPDLWELERAASEVGMQVRYVRTFGEMEIRRQGREIATVWRDRSNDKWRARPATARSTGAHCPKTTSSRQACAGRPAAVCRTSEAWACRPTLRHWRLWVASTGCANSRAG